MQSYFQDLNYTMANEDTTLEYQIAEQENSHSILTVGGSGSRSLPFLALPIKELRIVDVSADQLKFIEIKLESIRQLTRSECIALWTSEDYVERRDLFNKLKLANELKEFFNYHLEHNQQIPPLYWGKWERTFKTFSKITSLLFPLKVRKELFDSTEAHQFYEEHIEGIRWEMLLKIVGNKAIFNSLLYKGNFIKKNSPLSYFEYYQEAFQRLFRLDIKRSHFLQLCFHGKVIHNEALPIEFSTELFEKIKYSNISPVYEQGSIFNRSSTEKYDLISLSDVPSYLSGELEKKYLQSLKPCLNSGGLIINRFYLRHPEGSDLKDFEHVTLDYSNIISRELVQMYEVQILKHAPGKG
jgi:S-adenosylmethionine-diacylglycerol 3-amino-3-carboxypropyl transferase